MDKEIATFACKSTSISKDSEPGGGHCFQINLEGTATGEFEGVLLATMAVKTNDFKSGTFSTDNAVYMKNGAVVTGKGVGVFTSLGGHRWKLHGHALVGDGRVITTESEFDLATRSLNGKVYA